MVGISTYLLYWGGGAEGGEVALLAGMLQLQCYGDVLPGALVDGQTRGGGK